MEVDGSDAEGQFHEHLHTIPNEGEGDCAYIAIAQALTRSNGTASTTKEQDLLPAGRLQAQLRLLAAKEMQAHPADYRIASDSEIPINTRTAGVWAHSQSLSALASAANVDIYVWAFDQGQWTLYHIRPKKKPGAALRVLGW